MGAGGEADEWVLSDSQSSANLCTVQRTQTTVTYYAFQEARRKDFEILFP